MKRALAGEYVYDEGNGGIFFEDLPVVGERNGEPLINFEGEILTAVEFEKQTGEVVEVYDLDEGDELPCIREIVEERARLKMALAFNWCNPNVPLKIYSERPTYHLIN